MSKNIKDITPLFIWIISSAIALVTLYMLAQGNLTLASMAPNQVDSFYHARRIIDTANNFKDFFQFDPNIHAPEGSLLTWPWAFDFSLAVLLKIVSLIFKNTALMQILAFFPAVGYTVNIYLLLSITRVLKLSVLNQILSILCFISLPINITLHSIGRIDHHFIELSLVLASLLYGIKFLKHPERRLYPMVLGGILGAAPAFQCGLFILQVPIVCSLVYIWIFNLARIKNLDILALSLTITTLIFLMPSMAFLSGHFAFYLHSWFHLYIALGSSTIIILSSLPKHSKNITLLCTIITLLFIPIISQAITGLLFILNKLPSNDLVHTEEMLPALSFFTQYTDLFFIFPVLLGYLCYTTFKFQKFNHNKNYQVFLCSHLVFGSILLLCQYRLHYFGSLGLFLPLLIITDPSKFPSFTTKEKKILAAATIILIALFLHPIPKRLLASYQKPFLIGGDEIYTKYLPVMSKITTYCQQEPGIILAETALGHYLRYHTSCSVIANRMLITPQHFIKAERLNYLLENDINIMLHAKEPIKYILIDSFTRNIENKNAYPQDSLAHLLLNTKNNLYSNHLELLFEYTEYDHKIRLYKLI